jgi:competence ComEA-like helix-hairpin-helix protein
MNGGINEETGFMAQVSGFSALPAKPMSVSKARFSKLKRLQLWLICGMLLFCALSKALAQTNEKLNLNTASAAQLETLPGIGPGLAKRILEYRGKHGPFKRPQDIIIVRGLSAKRFRQLAPFIRT